MKKGLILCFVVIVVIAVYLLIVLNQDTENKLEVERQLNALSQKYQTDGNVVIDFQQIAPFDWNVVYVFPPYTSPETINQQLGFEWNHDEAELLELSENIDLIVFVKDNKVTGYVRHERTKGDFKIENLSQMGYTRKESTFEFINEPGDIIGIRHFISSVK